MSGAIQLICLTPEIPDHDARRERLYAAGARWIIESDLTVSDDALLLGIHPHDVRGGETVGILNVDGAQDRLVTLTRATPQRVKNVNGKEWTMALCRFRAVRNV